MTLNQMPDLVLEEIFVYLSFEYLCSLRRVSVRFNSMCKGMLNSGFKSSQKNVAKCLTEMKIMRNFVADEMKEKIGKRIEILVGLEERVKLLNQCYSTYIRKSWCCFIPGALLDDICEILRKIKKDEYQMSTFRALKPFQEKSKNAMLHFCDKVLPRISRPYTLDLPSVHYNNNDKIKELETDAETLRTTLREVRAKIVAIENRIDKHEDIILRMKEIMDGLAVGKKRIV